MIDKNKYCIFKFSKWTIAVPANKHDAVQSSKYQKRVVEISEEYFALIRGRLD